ncbi:hypothetical protein [Microvirga massiliensis]|uniref:hypothetical protein n=1 Tax=Microvirga massiliensis TaxID=1033741 RepID=UPI00062B8034|nr:hypothetical protein [Microvirga massiliensis]
MMNPAIAAMLEDVLVEEDHELGGFLISAVWRGVDRPNTGGIGLPGKDAKLVPLVEKAMRDGAFWSHAAIATDVNGKTYVAAAAAVSGRHLKADLRRLGYL